MKEKELSQDINFWGLLEETLLFLVFWGSLKEKSADDPFSFIELFFSLYLKVYWHREVVGKNNSNNKKHIEEMFWLVLLLKSSV